MQEVHHPKTNLRLALMFTPPNCNEFIMISERFKTLREYVELLKFNYMIS